MVRNTNEKLGDRRLREDPVPESRADGGSLVHVARIPHRTSEDRVAEADDAALRYFLRRTSVPVKTGEKTPPRLCPYCGSSGLVTTVRIGDERVIVSKFQTATEGKDILCLHCHRVWVITLLGWE